jgi:hypothetical protein
MDMSPISLAELLLIAARQFGRQHRTPAAEVTVFPDDESYFYESFKNNVDLPLIWRQRVTQAGCNSYAVVCTAPGGGTSGSSKKDGKWRGWMGVEPTCRF